MKTALKRTLSLMLTVVMLVSCWVFTAPKASAASTTYAYTVTVTTTNTCDSNDKDSGSTTPHYIELFGKANNGTNSQTSIVKKTNVPSSYFQNKDTYTFSGTSALFPTAVTVYKWTDDNFIFNRKWEGTVKIQVGGTEIMSYSMSLEGKKVYHSDTGNVIASNYPYANSIESCTYSDLSVTSDTLTRTPSTTVVDQYGVKITASSLSVSYAKDSYKYDSTSGSNATNDIKFTESSGKIEAATSGYKANGHNIHYVNVTASATFNGSTKTKATSLKITYPQYTATYKYKTTNASTLSSPTENTVTASDSYKAYYGDTPSAPTLSAANAKYYTADNHWLGGSFTAPTLKSNKTVWPTYTTNGAAHSYTYSPISNDDTNHTASCTCGYSKTVTHSYSGTWTSYDDTYHKDTCGTSGCAHVKKQYHTYGETSFVWANGNTTATASRTCSVCKHTQSAAATMTHTEKTAATCTEKGWNTYIATSPFANESNVKASKDVQDIPIDSTNHNFATPTVKDAALRTPATCTSDATYWYSCSRCGAVSVESESSSHYFTDEGSALGHKWSEYTQVLAPTCTTVGSEQKTCSRCAQTEAREIPARGHSMQRVDIEPGNGFIGSVYFQCTNANCGLYQGAEYNQTKEKYEPVGNLFSDPSEIKEENMPIVPTTVFNEYAESNMDFEHDYANRGGSLKIAAPYEYTDANTIQGMRFTASLFVPEDVALNCNVSDNYIVDFGFLWSQVPVLENQGMTVSDLRFNESTEETELPKNVYKMSVVKNNKGVDATEGTNDNFTGDNWTGVSAHEDLITARGTALTFNILINVKARNWKKDYCVRPYIKYKYNGTIYTIYDDGNGFDTDYSRNVAYVAQEVYDSPIETPKAQQYCETKILNNLKYIPEP